MFFEIEFQELFWLFENMFSKKWYFLGLTDRVEHFGWKHFEILELDWGQSLVIFSELGD